MRSEAAARESLARFEGIFNSRVVGLTVFDAAAGRTVAINDHLLDLLGYTREEFQEGGLDWPSVTPPEYHEPERRAFRQLLEAGKVEPFEKEYVRKDGTRIPVSVSGAPIPGLSGQYAVFVEDITRSGGKLKRKRRARRGVRNDCRRSLPPSPAPTPWSTSRRLWSRRRSRRRARRRAR